MRTIAPPKRREYKDMISPPSTAIVRSFKCWLCGQHHLQTGIIVLYWDNDTVRQAAKTCWDRHEHERKEG